MPPAKKKPMKKAMKKAPKKAPRKRQFKSKTNASDFASCTVTRTLTGGLTNQMFSYDSFILADFTRAVAIAGNYQHYRISGIKLTFKPDFTVFSNGLGAPAQQQPYLYYMIDKSGSIPDNVSLESLKQMGARPRKFATNMLSVSWRPSVLTEDLNVAGAAAASSYKISPWISTNIAPTNPGTWNPSRVAHQGIKWYMEQNNGNQYGVRIDVEVQFQFKKPLFAALSTTPALGLEYAILDASPDGIQGGSDGITVPLA